MRLLIVEPDAPLGAFLHKCLQEQGYLCEIATSADEGCKLLERTGYGLCLAELSLPQKDGLSFIQQAHRLRPQTPILALASTPAVELRVAALDGGADDCMVKPFSLAELSARLRVLARRTRPSVEAVLRVADLELDRIRRRVQRSGRPVELTQTEFALLEYLMCHAGATVTRSAILEKVWNFELDNATNIVDVYINYLRKKIDGDFSPKLIRTVRGIGYRLATSEVATPLPLFTTTPAGPSVSGIQ